jgi:hypothetical protein
MSVPSECPAARLPLSCRPDDRQASLDVPTWRLDRRAWPRRPPDGATYYGGILSYEVLRLVGCERAGAHDLLRMARCGRSSPGRGESHYYTELKRLARLGYLDARKEPGRTRERAVYTLTERGWMRSPTTRARRSASRRSRANRCCDS